MISRVHIEAYRCNYYGCIVMLYAYANSVVAGVLDCQLWGQGSNHH